jgi:hypothetical protein
MQGLADSLSKLHAAKSIGQQQWFSANNKLLSKFAHPTAGLVLGIMHQTEKHRHLQALLTTSGLYFAGQCVIALEEMTQQCLRNR